MCRITMVFADAQVVSFESILTPGELNTPVVDKVLATARERRAKTDARPLVSYVYPLDGLSPLLTFQYVKGVWYML